MVARRPVQGWEARHAPRQDGRRFAGAGAGAGLARALWLGSERLTGTAFPLDDVSAW